MADIRITAAEWERVSRLLDEVLELDPAHRPRWLESLSAEHADLRDTLRELLLNGDKAETSDFLPRLAQIGLDSGVAAGDVVGPYRLIRELGSGGMASVWLAERVDGSLKRQVALKLPRVLFSDGGLEARMARERDILSSLEHPHIARLYDAGVDSKGRPYLALEYVDGVPVDVYCREHALSIRLRLELFLQIARALAFAHARLVVHRDLKPANILVTANGDARLLDFGVARLLQADFREGPQHTQFGVRAFTPAYAAPEQFTGESVTVATDVYSLGVLLYELLTGTSPYVATRNTPAALEEAVLRAEPPLASSVAKANDSRALRGDLDNILARALRKSATERYASVEAFATDIERYLQGRPVTARAPSRWYVARKFIRRNALTLGVTTAVGLALAIGVGVAVWQAQEAARQRTIALERLTEAEDAGDFMSALLIEGIRSSEAVTLDELLTRSESIAERSGQNDPRLRRFAINFVAKWYISYGLYDRAERFLTRNLQAKPAIGTSHAAELVCTRAEAWANLGRREEAVQALMTEIAQEQNDRSIVAQCLLIRGRIAAADRDVQGALRYALEGQRQAEASGKGSMMERASALGQLGYAYSLNEEPDRAFGFFEQAMSLFREAGRAESDASVGVRSSWGTAAISRGTPKDALVIFDEALAIAKKRSPTGDPPASVAASRATALRVLGMFDEAVPAAEYAAQLAMNNGDRVEQIYMLHASADLARRMGDGARAQQLLDDAAARMTAAKVAPQSLAAARHRLFQAQTWSLLGRTADAEKIFDEVIGYYVERDCCKGALSMALVGRSQIAALEKRFPAALSDAQRALEVARTAQGRAPHSNYTGGAWFAIGNVRELEGRKDLARDAYGEAVRHLTNALGDSNDEARHARDSLARLSRS